MAGQHLGNRQHRLFELLHILGVVLFERNMDERHYLVAELARVEPGVVAADHPFTLEPLDPAPARRRRQRHPFGQVGAGQARIRLQLAENFQIDTVELHFCHVHAGFSLFLKHSLQKKLCTLGKYSKLLQCHADIIYLWTISPHRKAVIDVADFATACRANFAPAPLRRPIPLSFNHRTSRSNTLCRIRNSN